MNMNETSIQTINHKYTFWQLLSKYYVEIPIIQRDYAQGRNTDNAIAIRKELLDCIYKALIEDESINFDFVYGTVEGDKLLPLDGQQRLTTFFLLHWYIAQKEGRMEEARENLSKFSYTTRISSRDFCERILSFDYTPERNKKVSDFIKNENKYFKTWDNDPTIKHMLVMLDSIHEKFCDTKGLFDKLVSSEEGLLTFNFLPMEHYSLTDDLYIKMNARGKALSLFENFKAKFIQHMKEKNLSYEYFEANIDGKWTDFFWDFRDKNNTIDNQFMNYFCFVTEMLFLEKEEPREGDSPFKPNKIHDLIDYYQTEEDVQFLYDYLDLWSGKEEADTILLEVFSHNREVEKVRLFDGKPDLLSIMIQGEPISLMNKLLLFSVMKRIRELGKDLDIGGLRDYVRVVRNYLLNTRAFVRKKGMYTPDLRFGRFAIPIMQNYIDRLCDEQDVYRYLANEVFDNLNGEIIANEKQKAVAILENPELKDIIQGAEDLIYFRSTIFNILPYILQNDDEDLVGNLEALFDYDDKTKIIQALISVWDYGIRVGGSVFGDRYYYGNLDNLYSIMTYDGGEEYKKFLSEFVSQFEKADSEYVSGCLDEIMLNNLKRMNKDDWRYTIVKYENTVRNNISINSRNVCFAKEICDDNSVLLHKINGMILTGYHAVPEYMEVYQKNPSICTGDYIGYASNGPGYIHLSFSDEIKIGFDHSGILTVYTEKEMDDKWVTDAIKEYSRLELEGKDKVEQCQSLIEIIKKHYDKHHK